MSFERHTQRAKAKRRPAASVGNGKAVTTYSDFAMVDDGEADTSRANDHYTAVASIMCAEASDGCIVYIANGSERMWPGSELLKQSFAANTRKAYDRIHLAKFAGRQSGVGCSCPAGALDGCQRTVNAQTQRSRAGLAAT